jgi:hypothetical protein
MVRESLLVRSALGDGFGVGMSGRRPIDRSWAAV